MSTYIAHSRDFSTAAYIRHLLAVNARNLGFLAGSALDYARKRIAHRLKFGTSQRKHPPYDLLLIPESSLLWPDHILVYCTGFCRNLLVIRHSAKENAPWAAYPTPSGWGSLLECRIRGTPQELGLEGIATILAGKRVKSCDIIRDRTDLECLSMLNHILLKSATS